MNLSSGRDWAYLAVLICLYSLFEYFLKRLWWKPTEDYGHSTRTVVTQAGGLFLTLFIGSAGFVTFTLGAGYAAMAALYGAWLYLSKRQTKEEYLTRSLSRFLSRQAAMGIAIVVLWRISLPLSVHSWYAAGGDVVLSGFGAYADVLREKLTLILSVTASYLFMIDGGTRVVKGIMGKFPGLLRKVNQALQGEDLNNAPTASATETEENVGEWIGFLERIITLTFVLTGNFTALAFVLTAKSIARFKELEQSKDFAEYYLLGTSGSMLCALGIGILVRMIFGL